MRLALALAILVVGVGSASAADLTCAEFRKRLAASIDAGGNTVAQIREYRLGYGSEATGKRYDWDDIVGLEGTLSCGANDEFGNFSASIDYGHVNTKETAAEASTRLAHLAVASVCALTSSPQSECYVFAITMADRATRQFKKESDRGEKMPAGEADVELFKGVDAEFSLTPGAVSWMIGPEDQAQMTADRLPLTPSRRDAD